MWKKIRKLMCMSLALVILIQPMQVGAVSRTRQADWNLYFNPSAPSSEWMLSVKKVFTPHQTTGTFYVDSVSNSQTYVGVKVINYSTEYQKNKSFSFSVSGLPVGVTQYVKARLAYYPNKVTKATGHASV